MLKQWVLRIVLYLVICLGFSTAVFSNCVQEPSYFELDSGSNSLGTFERGDLAYVHGDLEDNPLSINAVFENSQESCYSDSQSMEVRLGTSQSITADDVFEEQKNATTYLSSFEFLFSGFPLQSPTTMQYSLNEEDFSTALNIAPDNQNPRIEFSDDVNTTYSPGEEVLFTYTIEDSKSGLSSANIDSDIDSNDLDVTNKSSYQGEFSEVLDESKQIRIDAWDRVGNSAVETVTIEVDNQGPQITDFSNMGFAYNGATRTVSFSTQIEEENFENPDSIEQYVSAEESDSQVLSNINRPTECEKQEDGVYRCVWDDIVITAEETTDIQLQIQAEDTFGNTNSQQFSTTIFIDNQNPEIERFEVINGRDERNIISGFGDNTTIYLEYSDQTVETTSVDTNFDIMDGVDSKNCGLGCVEWDISNQLEKYQGDARDEIPLSVVVSDEFDNVIQETINITLDNAKPTIENTSIEERDQVRDGVYKSGENIDITVTFTEEHFDEEKVIGLFDRITGDNRDRGISASRCREIEEDNYKCYFENIELATGHFTRNATIIVDDNAGNRAVEDIEIEVLQLNDDDVPTAFTIDDIEILNPLNRNVFVMDEGSASVPAWFEGEISRLEDSYEIVNYEFNQCNTSFVGGQLPFKENSPNLYPEPTRTTFNSDNLSEFILRANIGSESSVSYNTLQDSQVDCSISLLFRDDTTLYEPNINLNFTLNFSFYDLPRNNQLRAQAESLKEDIEDANRLGETFDDTYEIYNTLNNVCSTISTVGSLWGSLKTVWDPSSNSFKANPLTYGIGKSMDEASNPTQGAISELGFAKDGYVNTICGYLTCELGTLDVTENFLENRNQDMGKLICNQVPAASSGGSGE